MNLTLRTRTSKVFGAAIGAWLALATVTTSGQNGNLVVSVTDRSTGSAIVAVSVRVSQVGKSVGTGITGPDGTVTFSSVNNGQTTIQCEKDLYLRRPEESTTTVSGARSRVEMTLLRANEGQAYFRQAGQRIEAEALTLPAEVRNRFYLTEWARVQLLTPEMRSTVYSELKGAQAVIRITPGNKVSPTH